MIGPHTDPGTGPHAHTAHDNAQGGTHDSVQDGAYDSTRHDSGHVTSRGSTTTSAREPFRTPPYVLTNGRTTPSTPLDLMALVRTTGRTRLDQLRVNHAKALALCHKPVSVAEVAARLGHPLTVVKIWLSDLIEIGAVIAKVPPPAATFANDPKTLEAVLDGLRNLS